MSSTMPFADEIVCHCLRITESEVRTAVETTNASTVRSIIKTTDAGSGCTVCHCRIKQLIAEHKAKLAQPVTTESFI
jgi:bacterioferritin-associated ferredoxin